MIQPQKQSQAILAIKNLIIEARFKSYEWDSDTFLDFLDRLEYLPGLMLDDEDTTEWFGNYLKEFCEKYHYEWIYNKYIKDI